MKTLPPHAQNLITFKDMLALSRRCDGLPSDDIKELLWETVSERKANSPKDYAEFATLTPEQKVIWSQNTWKTKLPASCIHNKWSRCWAIIMNTVLILVAVTVGYMLGG